MWRAGAFLQNRPLYRVTSLIINRHSAGPYSMTCLGSYGGLGGGGAGATAVPFAGSLRGGGLTNEKGGCDLATFEFAGRKCR